MNEESVKRTEEREREERRERERGTHVNRCFTSVFGVCAGELGDCERRVIVSVMLTIQYYKLLSAPFQFPFEERSRTRFLKELERSKSGRSGVERLTA